MAMALTDSILLGGLGDAPLAAGGLAAGLFFTTIVILQGSMSAASIRIAQAPGAKSNRGGHSQVGRIVASALLLGLLLSLPPLLLGHVGWLMRQLGESAALARDVGACPGVLR